MANSQMVWNMNMFLKGWKKHLDYNHFIIMGGCLQFIYTMMLKW